jgi:RNA polymerase sigma-70 factor (ECF subfamily)
MPDADASSAAAPAALPDDEQALLAACAGGDVRAFMALAGRHHAALRALASCWPGGAHDAERGVARAWIGLLDCATSARGRAVRGVPAPAASLRARAAREVVRVAVERTRAALEPTPAELPGVERFFAPDHDLWPGEWADPPRPWGSSAQRRLDQRDIPRAPGRIVRELGVAPSAVLTLCDLHGWPVSECAFALELDDARVRGFLRAGREGVRAALEAEIDSR